MPRRVVADSPEDRGATVERAKEAPFRQGQEIRPAGIAVGRLGMENDPLLLAGGDKLVKLPLPARGGLAVQQVGMGKVHAVRLHLGHAAAEVVAVALAGLNARPAQREERRPVPEENAVVAHRAARMRRALPREGDEPAVRARVALQVRRDDLDAVNRALRPGVRRRMDKYVVLPQEVDGRDARAVDPERRLVPVDAIRIDEPEPNRRAKVG